MTNDGPQMGRVICITLSFVLYLNRSLYYELRNAEKITVETYPTVKVDLLIKNWIQVKDTHTHT